MQMYYKKDNWLVKVYHFFEDKTALIFSPSAAGRQNGNGWEKVKISQIIPLEYYDENEAFQNNSNNWYMLWDVDACQYPRWGYDGTEEIDNRKIKKVIIYDKIVPTNTSYWFFDFESLETIENINNLDTSNVKSMSYMFGHCKKLQSIDLSSFNTINVTSMDGMFYSCSSLKKLDLSKFNTSNVKDMSYMFILCTEINEINLKSFNTSNVENMEYMFKECTSLESLDLSSFNIAKATNMEKMFAFSSGLKTIYVSNNWNISSVTECDEMFEECSSIKGGAGTTFDLSKVDSEYAHIDGGQSNPGYLTEKK